MRHNYVANQIRDLERLKIYKADPDSGVDAALYNDHINFCIDYWKGVQSRLGDERFIPLSAVGHGDSGDKHSWNVIGEFAEKFEFLGAESNNDVANIVKKAKLLPRSARMDCESSCFYAYFTTKKSATDFVENTNAFLKKKHLEIQAAKVI